MELSARARPLLRTHSGYFGFLVLRDKIKYMNKIRIVNEFRDAIRFTFRLSMIGILSCGQVLRADPKLGDSGRESDLPRLLQNYVTLAKSKSNLRELVLSLKLDPKWEDRYLNFLTKKGLDARPIPEMRAEGGILEVANAEGNFESIDLSQGKKNIFSVNGKKFRMESNWSVEKLVTVIEKLGSSSHELGAIDFRHKELLIALLLPRSEALLMVAWPVLAAIGATLSAGAYAAYSILGDTPEKRAQAIIESLSKKGAYLTKFDCSGGKSEYGGNSSIDDSKFRVILSQQGKEYFFYADSPKDRSREIYYSEPDSRCTYNEFKDKSVLLNGLKTSSEDRDRCNILLRQKTAGLEIFKIGPSYQEIMDCAMDKGCCGAMNAKLKPNQKTMRGEPEGAAQ